MIMAIKDGDKVKIEYTGKLEDGTIFDSSTHGDHTHPLEFEVGKRMIIKGLEDEIIGMEKGQEKTVNISKENAYGDRNEQLIAKVPKDKLPKDVEVKVGMMLLMAAQDGRQMPAVVKEVGEAEVTLDLNHPLAGKDLTFDFKVVDVQDAGSAPAPENAEPAEAPQPAEQPAESSEAQSPEPQQSGESTQPAEESNNSEKTE